MRRLLLMRHAKADPGHGVPTDHERPLSPRGVVSAGVMGRLLTAIGQTPDLVVTSSAVRAATTAEIAADAGDWTVEIRPSHALYESGPDGVLKHLSSTPGDVERLLLVGHQPVWGQLVHRLTGAVAAMRTGTVAVVDLLPGTSWRPGREPGGELIALLQPRHFAHAESRTADHG